MKWFRHELQSRDSDQIWELIDVHGMQGYGIWWVILEECYKAESGGFQIEATETWFKRLSKSLNLTDWRTLIRVLDTMSEIGLICPQLWAEHVIVVPGILDRADNYMKKKRDNAERQRRYRQSSKVSRDSNALRNAEKARVTLSDADPESDTESEKEKYSPPPFSKAGYQHPAQQMEERLARGGKSPHPWVTKSINAFQHEYDPEMLEAVLEYLKTTPGHEKIAPTMANAKGWLGVCNDPNNPNYMRRMELAFIAWESAQNLKARKEQQRQQQATGEDEKKEILTHLYRRWGGVPS